MCYLQVWLPTVIPTWQAPSRIGRNSAETE